MFFAALDTMGSLAKILEYLTLKRSRMKTIFVSFFIACLLLFSAPEGGPGPLLDPAASLDNLLDVKGTGQRPMEVIMKTGSTRTVSRDPDTAVKSDLKNGSSLKANLLRPLQSQEGHSCVVSITINKINIFSSRLFNVKHIARQEKRGIDSGTN
jgi:hypothetical protein